MDVEDGAIRVSGSLGNVDSDRDSVEGRVFDVQVGIPSRPRPQQTREEMQRSPRPMEFQGGKPQTGEQLVLKTTFNNQTKKQ